MTSRTLVSLDPEDEGGWLSHLTIGCEHCQAGPMRLWVHVPLACYSNRDDGGARCKTIVYESGILVLI